MKKNLKRIGAILLILIIAGLYVWAIVAAVMARPEAMVCLWQQQPAQF